MYQAWIQFKNYGVTEEETVDYPTEEFSHATGEQDPVEPVPTIKYDIPSWDNIICTMRYNEKKYTDEEVKLRDTSLKSKKVEDEENTYPGVKDVILGQTCGFQLLSMYDTGTWDQVGKGPDGSKQKNNCNAWKVDEKKTGFRGDDKVEAICTFWRPLTDTD